MLKKNIWVRDPQRVWDKLSLDVYWEEPKILFYD